jgi:hypothetical protein
MMHGKNFERPDRYLSAIEMANWPVTDNARSEFEDLKATHRVRPLPVYMAQTFVEAADVKAAMNNALVEVHFCLKHYRIGKDADRFDSFSGTVEQVIILRRGVFLPSSAYKRKNVRDGPFVPKPAPTPTSEETSTGTLSLPQETQEQAAESSAKGACKSKKGKEREREN